MEEKILATLDKVNETLDKMDQRLDKMDEEIKEIRAQQFLFEHEYGAKIDAIFDAVTLELDKNLEKSNKIRILEGRMDRNEATIFNHEKRISNLELNQ